MSYSFKELSLLRKRRGLLQPLRCSQAVPIARDHYADSVQRASAGTGLPMNVVGAHGGFVYRRLRTASRVILVDPEFRRHIGVDQHTHDGGMLRHLPGGSRARRSRVREPTNPAAAIQASGPHHLDLGALPAMAREAASERTRRPPTWIRGATSRLASVAVETS